MVRSIIMDMDMMEGKTFFMALPFCLKYRRKHVYLHDYERNLPLIPRNVKLVPQTDWASYNIDKNLQNPYTVIVRGVTYPDRNSLSYNELETKYNV